MLVFPLVYGSGTLNVNAQYCTQRAVRGECKEANVTRFYDLKRIAAAESCHVKFINCSNINKIKCAN